MKFVFPGGIVPSYSEELPKLYSIILTNEKGVRSYIYILKIFEKINIKEIISEKDKNTSGNSNVHNIMDIYKKLNTSNNLENDDYDLKDPLLMKNNSE